MKASVTGLIKVFANISLIKSPTYPERLVFACDDLYFLKYGVYHILSCNLAGHHVHCHVINPSEETIQTYEKIVSNITIDLSFSTETVSLTGWPLRSYYFFSRFFVSLWLLETFKLSTLYVTDTDVIIKSKISIKTDKLYGAIYHPESTQPWRKINGNFYFFKKGSEYFLKNVIDRFKTKHASTNFNQISDTLSKDELGNITALDQVCVGEEVENFNDPNFINLVSLPPVVSKHEDYPCSIWSLTGGGQKGNLELMNRLDSKFKGDWLTFSN